MLPNIIDLRPPEGASAAEISAAIPNIEAALARAVEISAKLDTDRPRVVLLSSPAEIVDHDKRAALLGAYREQCSAVLDLLKFEHAATLARERRAALQERADALSRRTEEWVANFQTTYHAHAAPLAALFSDEAAIEAEYFRLQREIDGCAGGFPDGKPALPALPVARLCGGNGARTTRFGDSCFLPSATGSPLLTRDGQMPGDGAPLHWPVRIVREDRFQR